MRYLKFIALLFFFLFSGVHLLIAEMPTVHVSQVTGEVKVVREGSEQIVQPGEMLLLNDVIQTGEGGQVDIIWKGQWGYRLLANSECVLKNLAKEEAEIEMVQGDIIVKVQKLAAGQKFRVSTPVAVAAVRGTQFWGRVKPEEDDVSHVTFAVREGEVDVIVKAYNQTYEVNANEALDIYSRPVLMAVRRALAVEMQAMAQADEIDIGLTA